MERHNIETLTKDLANLKRSVSGRFNQLNKKVDDKFGEIEPKVSEMHDYITYQKGVASVDKPILKPDGTINISKDVWGLIIKLILIIGALLGIKNFL